MALVVALFGLLVAGLGVVGLVNPPALRDGVKRLWDTGQGMTIAVVFRVVLGALLLLAASDTRFPTAIAVIGGITLVSGLLVPVVGSARVQALLDWWLGLSPGFVRAWAVVALAFGGFLLYAGL